MAELDTKSDTKKSAGNTAIKTASPAPSPATGVKIFRTLKGDIVDLVSQNETSRKALAKSDSRLGKQVEQYAAAGGDQKVSTSIISRQSRNISDEESITPEGLPFVIRKIREAHGDVDDDHLSREAIVNEIEKDYSDGSESGNEVIDLGGEQGRPSRNQIKDAGPRFVTRTVQGVTSSGKNGSNGSMRTLEGEQVYEETPLPDATTRRAQPAAPVQVEVKIDHKDTEDTAAPKVIYVEREPAPAAVPAAPQVKPDIRTQPVSQQPKTETKPKPQQQAAPRQAPKVEVRHEIKFTPTPPTAGLGDMPQQEPAVVKPAASQVSVPPVVEQKTPPPPQPPAVSKVTVSETNPSPKKPVKSDPIKTSFTPTPLSSVYSTPKPEAKTPIIKEEQKEKVDKKEPSQDLAPKVDDETLDEKIADIEAKIAECDAATSETKRGMEEMTGQRVSLQSSLDPIISKEKEVEAQENALDTELDHTINPETKREIEGKRWQLENERQKIEKDRWSVEQDIVTLDGKLKELSREQEKNTREKKSLGDKLEIAKAKKAAAAARIERADVARQLAEVKETEKSLETEWKTLHSEYEKSEHSLNALLKQAEDVRSDIRRISTREDQTNRPEERHKLEEERSKKEADRKNVEESELNTEEEAAKSEKLIADLQDKFQKIKSDELTLTAKIKELDGIIAKAGIQ